MVNLFSIAFFISFHRITLFQLFMNVVPIAIIIVNLDCSVA
jgi:hypothetical protein